LWLNGRLVGEFGLGGALCGYFDVPVIMVSGDQSLAAEASELIPGIEVAIVKQARSRYDAELLPLEVSLQKVREAAARAISRARADMAPPPYKLQPPVIVVIEFRTSDMADRASQIPGSERLDGRRVQCTAEDTLQAFRFFTSAVSLAETN
jgi:D-amino peptidase